MVETMVLLCLACWATLQSQWLHAESPTFATTIERILHSVLPPVSACVLTSHLTTLLAYDFNWGIDAGATLAPLLFASLLAAGMAGVASLPSSYQPPPEQQQQQQHMARQKDKTPAVTRSIDSADGCVHSAVLLLLPPLMHLATFRYRIRSSFASYDDLNDLLLALTVPYLIHYLLIVRTDAIWYAESLPALLRFGTGGTLRGALLPLAVSLVASLALQFRYLVPLCLTVSYQFNGHDVQSATITSVYLCITTLTWIVAGWFFGRRHETTGELLLGEYHEDVAQFLLVLGGFFAALGCGMPWSLIPMPTLSFMSLALWVTTRMLRYQAIFLFVVFSTMSILMSYRLTVIETRLSTPIPAINPTLLQYAMASLLTMAVIGMVVGIAVRAPGGVGTSYMRKIDVTGTLLAVYVTLLTMLEFVLLKQPVPMYDREKTDEAEGLSDEDGYAYAPAVSMLTSAMLIGMAWFLRRTKAIGGRSLVLIVSASIGKLVAVIIDEVVGGGGESAAGDNGGFFNSASLLWIRALITTLLLITICAPYVYLEPVHVKTTATTARMKRLLGPSGKPNTDVPKPARQTLFAYCAVWLPLVLVLSIPLVLRPLIGIVAGHYAGAYYRSAPVLSEVLGYAGSLWGLSVLSMTNYYLPDGGGELWKTTSALTFLMGLGVAFTAPTLPDWLWSEPHAAASSPFASISSLGVGGALSGRGRTGGWGLLSASLATLLALTGPLELRERRDPSGRKDKTLLLRLMLFSIMFGCGVSWFITIQSMSEEAFVPLFVTATACMAISFFGTVACVLGYFLELQSFDEVEQITKLWMGAFPLFLLMAGVSSFVEGAAHPFGMGGWLSTYLSVCGCVTLAYALALRSRSEKSASTRGLGNLSCVTSWICFIIVLYGKFGLTGIDVSSGMNRMFGVPASVIGTFVVAPILLVLEGETTDRKSRTYRLSSRQQPSAPSFGLNLTNLTHANRFAPPVAGTAVVLVWASLYAICFRGCGWRLIQGDSGGVMNVHTSHEDVFKSVYGVSSRTTGVQGGEDVASMAQKNLIHSQAVVTAARLAGSGFWTSNNVFGPLLHLGGVVAVIPSLDLVTSHMWSGKKHSAVKVLAMLPLTLIPLVICRGIPSLRAAALLGLVGGTIQALNLRQREWVGRMRI